MSEQVAPDLSPEGDRKKRRSLRRKVGILIAFYVVAFSATIPCIEVSDGTAARLARVHEDKADQCHRLGERARAAGQADEVDRLDRSARSHDWFAGAYRRQAAQTRWTWLTWVIKTMGTLGERRSG